MSGTKKYTVVLTLDQVAELLEQLSDKDKRKVVERLRRKPRGEAVDELIAVLSKVKKCSLRPSCGCG
jgi:histone acetyltransferase (RNA polymerase elongator complex component)